MFARALFSGPRVWCPLVFLRSQSSGAGRTSGRASPLGHAWEATLGTNKRLHTQALVRTSDGKPRDSDEEADNEGSKLSKLDAEQWEKIAAAYVHRDAPRAAGEASSTAAVHGAEQVSNPATVHGAEPEGRKDYDLEKLLANISVLKSAEQIQEEARKAERPRRTSAMSIAELVDFLRDENAQDICVINVPPEKQYVKYFVTCSGKGLRHLSKIAHSLVDEVKGVAPKNRRGVHVEGADSDDWMVVDMGDIVVHFMLPAVRNWYQLETLWTLGPRYDDQFQEVLREVMEAKEA